MRGLAKQLFDMLRQQSWLRRKPKPKGQVFRRMQLEALEDRFLPATSINQIIPAALTGTAFIDHNANGVLNPGELVLPGANITLTGKDSLGKAVSASVVTDVNGVYKFLQVNPGTYQLSLATNASFVNGLASAGSNGGIVSGSVISSISIGQGATLVGYNLAVEGLANTAGISLRQFLSTTLLVDGIPVFSQSSPIGKAGTGLTYADGAPPPAFLTASGTGSLAGFVRDNESVPNGIANVKIGLVGVTAGGANAGLPVNFSTTTDATGAYKFSNLAAGSYSINVITQPAGFRAGVPTLGSLDGFIRQNDVISGIDVTTTAATGYNFTEIHLPELSAAMPMEAHLVDDTAGPGTGVNLPGGLASDSITSDPTIGGQVINVGSVTSFTGALDGGNSITLPNPNADGIFLLSSALMNQLAGGTLADGRIPCN